MNQFIGVCPDGTNAVFSQYPWGQMSCSKKQSHHRAASWMRFMTAEVMSGFGATMLTILLLLVKHTGWKLHICFPSLLTNTKSHILFCMTIVVHIPKMLMVVVTLQLLCIVMTN